MGLKKILKKNADVLVFVSFLLLSILMTLPLIFNLNSIIESGESYYIIWSFWWIKKSLLELFSNPLYTNYLFYPVGINLIFYPLTLLHSLSSLPLQLFFNSIVSLNLIFILSFAVTGFSMYLLVKYLTNNKLAAFISGVIFAFCPFRFAQSAPHLHMLSTEFLPLYILFLIKTIKEKKFRNPIFASIFLFLSTLGDFHFTAYLIIFTGLFLFYFLLFRKKDILNREFFKKFGVFILSFIMLFIPLIKPIINELSTNKNVEKPLDPNIILSADIFSFLTPAQSHPIFGKYVASLHDKFTGNKREHTVFIGYTVLFLSLYSIFKIKNKETRLWFTIGLVFLILSLGPVLHAMGRFMFPSPFKLGNLITKIGINTSPLGKELLDKFIGIPLPFLALHFLPLFSMTRAPSRFSIMLMLCLAILAGYALNQIIRKSKKKYIIFILVFSLIVFEFIAIPIKLIKPNVPEFYKQISEDKEDYAIVEAPIEHNGTYAEKYYQIYHGKKIVGGGWTRASPEAVNFTDNIPLLRELKNSITSTGKVHNDMLNKIIETNPEAEPIIMKYIAAGKGVYSQTEKNDTENVSKDDIKKLREINVKYIVIHKFMQRETPDPSDKINFERMDSLVKSLLDNKTYFYEDNEIVVYDISGN